MENIDHTTKVLNQKKEALPDLRVAYKEALSHYEEASKARDQKKKVDELKKELAWSFVHDKGNQLQEAMDAAAKQERRLPKVEEGLRAAEARILSMDLCTVSQNQFRLSSSRSLMKSRGQKRLTLR